MSVSKDMIFSSEAATIHEVLELIGMAYFMDLKTEKKNRITFTESVHGIFFI